MRYLILWLVALAIAYLTVIAAFAISEDSAFPWVHGVIILGWIMGPPTWLLSKAALRDQGDEWDELPSGGKLFYEICTKFWASVTVLLVAVYTSVAWLPKQTIIETEAPVATVAAEIRVEKNNPLGASTPSFSRLSEGNPLRRGRLLKAGEGQVVSRSPAHGITPSKSVDNLYDRCVDDQSNYELSSLPYSANMVY